MARLLLNLSFIFAFLGALKAFGSEPSCASQFIDRSFDMERLIFPESTKIKNPEVVYQIKVHADSRYSDPSKVPSVQDWIDLFRKFGYTLFPNASDKITFEKGKMFLGHPIDKTTFVQAEYALNGGPLTFNLVKLTVVNTKNGSEQTLAKDFVSHDGSSLVKSDFTFVYEKGAALGKVIDSSDVKLSSERKTSDDSINTDNSDPKPMVEVGFDKSKVVSKELDFPLTISGVSVEKIKKWAKFLPYLAHSEIQAVDSVNRQRWVSTKGQFRRFKDFAQDRFFKQAFGWIMLFFIVDGVSNFSHDVAQYFVNITRSQQSTITVKVKEKHQDGELVSKEHKFEIVPQKSQNPHEVSPKPAKGSQP